MRQCFLHVFVIGLLTVSAESPAVADVALGFSPPSQVVNLGDAATVDIVVSDLGLSPFLGDFDLTVAFDPTILSLPNATNVTFGPLLGDPVTEAVTGETEMSGSLEFFEVSLLNPAGLAALQTSSSFTIATLSFGTVGPGTSLLTIGSVTLGDENGSPLSFTAQTGSITVVTPEPALLLPLALMFAALLPRSVGAKRAWLVGALGGLLLSKPAAAEAGGSAPLVLGPSSAPITIIEFSDFECPFCGKQAPIIRQLLEADPVHIRFLFHNSPLNIHRHAFLAHEAALAAGEQGKFWEMHDLLFANQTRLGKEDLIDYASQLGLNIDAFRLALETHRYAPLIERDLAEAGALGVSGTPTFLINGRKVVGLQSIEEMHALIHSTLVSELPSTTPAPAPGPKYIPAMGSPVRGSSSAVITVVEFADLECPFCRKAQPEITQILHEYSGDVRLVFKNFPLDIHPNAVLAHEAALVAGAHGKFWQMHDWIYAHPESLDRRSLIRVAKSLGLNTRQFATDLESHKYRAQVQADIAEGIRLGVDGTPTFFINGQELHTEPTFSGFRQMIDSQLKVAASKTARLGGE